MSLRVVLALSVMFGCGDNEHDPVRPDAGALDAALDASIPDPCNAHCTAQAPLTPEQFENCLRACRTGDAGVTPDACTPAADCCEGYLTGCSPAACTPSTGCVRYDCGTFSPQYCAP